MEVFYSFSGGILMEVVRTWEELLAWPSQRIVFTIGNFDGLHLGHGKVLEKAREMALKNDADLCVLTFLMHTRTVLGDTGGMPQRLMRNESRLSRLEEYGSVCCAEIPFTASFAEMEPHVFLEALCGGRPWFGIVVGDDFAFGRGRSGTADTLFSFASRHGGQVAVVPELSLEGERVSSTRIRELLAEGDVAFANRLLGYHYRSSGIRVKGESIGRTLGYPTVNLSKIGTLIPAIGVYATKTEIENGESYPSMTYVGTRPTLDGSSLVVESHLFGFSGYIAPGEPVTVEWMQFIRGDLKFHDLKALTEQLKRDESAVLVWFGN